MTPYYARNGITLYHGDCLDVLADLPADSIDAVITDPPYGLGFMGKHWDHGVPGVAFWEAVLRVAKPGAHILAFGGTRTQHRLTCAIEDAGWEIRDCLMWVYGSGFPKSLDVSKAIDKAAGAKREVVGSNPNHRAVSGVSYEGVYAGGNTGAADVTAPSTDAAKLWSGYGTALKPAYEPIILARKPLAGTVAANVLRYGTGAINVDGCRVGTFVNTTSPGTDRYNRANYEQGYRPYGRDGEPSADRRYTDKGGTNFAPKPGPRGGAPEGRWPANLIHDGSDEVLALFPETTGSAARFFYTAKASRSDREEDCEDLAPRTAGGATDRTDGTAGLNSPRAGASRPSGARNHHPTVKPTDLMRYLVKLITPPGGTVLDPFMGSGSTGKACKLEGVGFAGIDREAEYVEIAAARISRLLVQGMLL